MMSMFGHDLRPGLVLLNLAEWPMVFLAAAPLALCHGLVRNAGGRCGATSISGPQRLAAIRHLPGRLLSLRRLRRRHEWAVAVPQKKLRQACTVAATCLPVSAGFHEGQRNRAAGGTPAPGWLPTVQAWTKRLVIATIELKSPGTMFCRQERSALIEDGTR